MAGDFWEGELEYGLVVGALSAAVGGGMLRELVRTVGEYVTETELARVLQWWRECCTKCTTAMFERYSKSFCLGCKRCLSDHLSDTWWFAYENDLPPTVLCETCHRDLPDLDLAVNRWVPTGPRHRIYWGRERPSWRSWPEFLAVFDVDECCSKLRLSTKFVPETQWLKSAKRWFHFSAVGAVVGSQWDELAAVNGARIGGIGGLAATPLGENPLEWLPFDHRETPQGLVFALSNCNPSSSRYQHVALARVCSDAYRTPFKTLTVYLTRFTIDAYAQKHLLANDASAILFFDSLLPTPP